MGIQQAVLAFKSPTGGGASPDLPVTSGLQLDFDPNAYAGIDQAAMVAAWGYPVGVPFEGRQNAGVYWQAPGTTHSCNNLATAYFDGTSYGSFVDAGTTDVNGPVLTSFTIFGVVKVKNDGSSHVFIGGLSGGAEVYIDGSDKVSSWSRAVLLFGSGSTSLSTTLFKQFAVTYDGSTASYYLSGSADGTTSASTTITGKTQYIGNGSSGGYNYLARGAVWNRVLNGGELSSLFSWAASRYAV